MLWEVGYASIMEQEAKHCSFDMSECYMAKTVPVIFDTSLNYGYQTGG